MGLVERDFHIFLSHFLALALLNTFNTDAFGGALFIMHFRPHSGCFLLTFRLVCCKVICSPVTNNSPSSLQPDHCRSGGSKIPFFLFCFHAFFFFPSHESQERMFWKATNKPVHVKPCRGAEERSVLLGSRARARPCCCWSRGCFACCRCCGPRCCSRRWAGASRCPVRRLSHLALTGRKKEEGRTGNRW